MSDYQIKNPIQMTKDVESFVPGVGPIVDGKLSNAPDDLESSNLTKTEAQAPTAQPTAPVAPPASPPQPTSAVNPPQPTPANPAPVEQSTNTQSGGTN